MSMYYSIVDLYSYIYTYFTYFTYLLYSYSYVDVDAVYSIDMLYTST